MTRVPPWRDEPDAVYVLLNSAPSALVGVNAGGIIDYVNKRTLTLFGYGADELIGQPLALVLPPDRAGLSEEARSGFARDPRVRVVAPEDVVEATHADGTSLPVELQITSLATTHGPWFLTSVSDVTERRAREVRAQSLSRAYVTLARMNQAIVRATTARELFEQTCRMAVEEGGFLAAWVGSPGSDGSVVVDARSGRLDDYIDGLRISLDPDDPRGQGPTGRALRDGGPEYVSDYFTDASTQVWHEAGDRAGVRGAAALPLHRGGRVVSVLTLYADDLHFFDDRMRELLEGMAASLSSALDAYEARSRLERVAAQRRDLLRRLVRAQEEERARIAADVHDDSVQLLAALDLRLGLLLGSAHDAAPSLAPAIVQLQEIAASVTKGLRDLLFELEPFPPGAGLTELLRDVASHAFRGVAMTWSVTEPDGPVSQLPDELLVTAVRIAQESFVNVLKHAHASEVRVGVAPERDGVRVRISDNGVGLQPENLRSRPGHRGLATMRARAEAAGGHCHVESLDGETTVHLWVPRRASSAVID